VSFFMGGSIAALRRARTIGRVLVEVRGWGGWFLVFRGVRGRFLVLGADRDEIADAGGGLVWA